MIRRNLLQARYHLTGAGVGTTARTKLGLSTAPDIVWDVDEADGIVSTVPAEVLRGKAPCNPETVAGDDLGLPRAEFAGAPSPLTAPPALQMQSSGTLPESVLSSHGSDDRLEAGINRRHEHLPAIL